MNKEVRIIVIVIQPSCFANEDAGPRNVLLSLVTLDTSSLATYEIDVCRPQFILFPLYIHLLALCASTEPHKQCCQST